MKKRIVITFHDTKSGLLFNNNPLLMIHMYVSILHSKFDLILIKIRLFTNFKSWFKIWTKTMYNQFFKKAKAIVHGFFQKMAPKSPQIFITFSDTY